MLTNGMHDDLNLIQHSAFIEETDLLGRSSVQMTVNDSFECSDIDLGVSVPVRLRQLQVSFGLSFRCCTLACGKNMAPSSGVFARECPIVTL